LSFINACKGCIEKQRENDSLRQENEFLKARFRYLENKLKKPEQGFSGYLIFCFLEGKIVNSIITCKGCE